MTYFDHPQLFPPPPPPQPPAAPPPRRSTGLLSALVVLAVIALLGGIAVGRVTAPHSSNSSALSPFLAPGGQLGGSGSSNGGTGGGSNPGATGAAGNVTRAVVNINTTLGSGAAAGTGMIVTSNGDVVTNNHVINGATSVSVELPNGSNHKADVLGYDATDDVALIHVQGVSGLPTINTSSGNVSVGDAVIALGNALGRGGAPTVVTGKVTDVHQTITASDDDGANAETLHDLIQTDAPIQPGDSGGPLTNGKGQVIGMDAAASASRGFGFRQTSSAQGYAIPISQALSIAHQIAHGNETAAIHIGARGILGVQLGDPSSDGGFGSGFGGFGSGSSGNSTNGAPVAAVQPGSPADHAGIGEGDVITNVSGHSISSATDLSNEMNAHHPGEKVPVTWTDTSGANHHATLKLEAGPPA